MRLHRLPIPAILLAFGALCITAWSTDHADPMSTINPFKTQDDPVANITDLHAFLVDQARQPILDQAKIKDADQLIVSLCVRRRLLPWQIARIANDVPKYSFRVHLDLNPEVRFFDPAKTRDDRDYQETLNSLSAEVAKATAKRDAERAMNPPKPSTEPAPKSAAQSELERCLKERGALVLQHHQDHSLQALYGGILVNPNNIAEDALLDFHLTFDSDDENSEVELNANLSRIQGLAAPMNVVAQGRKSRDGTRDLALPSPWKDEAINIQCGIFDDPFIFPRFFRANVVGIVMSIPLQCLRRPDGSPARNGPILLWATTHRPGGKTSDHTGRSLRTQLPRFGYLNGLHPYKQAAEVVRMHEAPDLFHNVLTTFIPPLEAHRHYDVVPDVMVYDLRRPAAFPNGRWFADDVAKTLADAGETLLLELSYAESRQFPRATTNDKPFTNDFPYLAPRWTAAALADHAEPGSSIGPFDLPNAPDNDAIALPNFAPAIWRSLWLGLFIGILALGALAWLAVRGIFKKIVVILVAVAGLCLIHPIKAQALRPMDPGFMEQPQFKLHRTLLGSGLIGTLGLALFYAVGLRRGVKIGVHERIMPLGTQSEDSQDRQYHGSTFSEVRDAVFDEPYYGRTWGEINQRPLPVYISNFETIAQGFFSLTKRHLFLDAAARTLASRADLRWGGPERKGVRRLLHPNGICLTGVWHITDDNPYTGFFAKGSKAQIIGRYSTGLGVLRGQKRTLSLVGKLYPIQKPEDPCYPANFITQADLGADYPDSIHDAILRNAPDVTVWKRGFDIPSLLLIAFTFFRADRSINIRQLYEIAELGKPDGTPTRCPKFMQLTILSEKVRGSHDTADFRDEILAHIYDPGHNEAKRKLVFEIKVSDKGEFKGLLNRKLDVKVHDWKTIGTITFEKAAVSHNGDFVIHFHHPPWRNDVNDPNSKATLSPLAVWINKAAQWVRTLSDYTIGRLKL